MDLRGLQHGLTGLRYASITNFFAVAVWGPSPTRRPSRFRSATKGNQHGQAIVNPDELRRFATHSRQFNNDLLAQMTVLHGQLAGLGQTWRDREHDKFVEEFGTDPASRGPFRRLDEPARPVPDAQGRPRGRVSAAALSERVDDSVKGRS